MRKFDATSSKTCFETQAVLLNQYIEEKQHPRYIKSLGTSLQKMLKHESGKGRLTDDFNNELEKIHAELTRDRGLLIKRAKA